MRTVGSHTRSGIYLESTDEEQLGVLPGEGRFVKDLMSRKKVTVDTATSVKEAAEIMRDRDVSAVVVCRNDDPIGAFTEHDMIVNEGANVESPGSITVYEVIKTREMIRCREDTILADALRAMVEQRADSVPVINIEGSLVGVLSLVDAVGALTPDVAAAWLAKMRKSNEKKSETGER